MNICLCDGGLNTIANITRYFTDLSYNEPNLAPRSNIEGISGPITLFLLRLSAQVRWKNIQQYINSGVETLYKEL